VTESFLQNSCKEHESRRSRNLRLVFAASNSVELNTTRFLRSSHSPILPFVKCYVLATVERIKSEKLRKARLLLSHPMEPKASQKHDATDSKQRECSFCSTFDHGISLSSSPFRQMTVYNFSLAVYTRSGREQSKQRIGTLNVSYAMVPIILNLEIPP